jgi:hypothetical protein
VTEEDKTAEDAATRAGQGNDAEVPADRSDAEPPAASLAKRRRRKGTKTRIIHTLAGLATTSGLQGHHPRERR